MCVHGIGATRHSFHGYPVLLALLIPSEGCAHGNCLMATSSQAKCVLSTRSVYKNISIPNKGAKETPRHLMMCLQRDGAEAKCPGSEERPSQHVLVMVPPWSKATAF